MSKRQKPSTPTQGSLITRHYDSEVLEVGNRQNLNYHLNYRHAEGYRVISVVPFKSYNITSATQLHEVMVVYERFHTGDFSALTEGVYTEGTK